MMTLSRIALFSCLTIIVTHSAFASNLKCAELFTSWGPKGQLTTIQRFAGGSTGGKWLADENGVNWFVKRDVHYSELQTSAEPIAAQIYQHFGYKTPDTAKLVNNGVHYSASRDIGQNHHATDFSVTPA